MQRRGATRGRGAIHVGAGAEEELDAREMTLASGVVKGVYPLAPPAPSSRAAPGRRRSVARSLSRSPLCAAAHALRMNSTSSRRWS